MSVSTDGEICFGIVFGDGAELPWFEHDGFGDLEHWWRDTRGFKASVDPHDLPDGDESKAAWAPYFKEYKAWQAENPCPVVDVNYCSGGCPMFVLAVPSSSFSCSRGYPQEFDPKSLFVADEQVKALKDFCNEFGIEMPSEPKWLLCSYWDE